MLTFQHNIVGTDAQTTKARVLAPRCITQGVLPLGGVVCTTMRYIQKQTDFPYARSLLLDHEPGEAGAAFVLISYVKARLFATCGRCFEILGEDKRLAALE